MAFDFERFVREHQDRVYVFALGLTRSRAEADDVAQETFVRAYRALSEWGDERLAELQERAWLYRVCVNVVRNRFRAARIRPAAGLTEEVAWTGTGPEAAAMALAERERLWALVRGLPPAQRTAVLLHFIEGLSFPEVAEVMDMPVRTVKSHASRGVAMLRRQYAALEVA